jgi:hypothetical protein
MIASSSLVQKLAPLASKANSFKIGNMPGSDKMVVQEDVNIEKLVRNQLGNSPQESAARMPAAHAGHDHPA